MMHYNLNQQQADIVKKALELYWQIGIGQIDPIAEQLPLKADTSRYWVTEVICESVSDKMINNIDGWTSNLSIDSGSVKPEVKDAYQLWTQMNHD